MREERDAQVALLGALGRLWLAQVEIDGSSFYADEHRRRVLLPTYPFERKRYWIDPPAGAATTPLAPRSDVLPFDQWFHAPVWTQRMVASAAPAAAAHWVVFWVSAAG
jgi:acyl transferase domain-containing protein